MEHYRSTFATAATIVFGLVTASHIAYPHGPEEDRLRTRVKAQVYTELNTATTWSEPPRNDAANAEMIADEPAAQPRQAAFTQLAPETAALFSTVPATAVGSPRSTTVAKRPRAVRQASATRSAASMPSAPTETAAPTSGAGNPPAQGEKRVDLIGDLLRGLGIGREG